MRTMKYNIPFGIALVCAMLFAACTDTFEPGETQMAVENGYGRISISFVGEEATPQTVRTALPSMAFDQYVYTFTKTDGTPQIKTPDNDGFFVLEIGDYTVEVQAFAGDEEPYTLVASGVSPLFSVGSGSNNPVKVPLSRVTATGQGSFTYTITYPVGAEADITLKKWSDGTVIELNPVNLTQGNGKNQTIQLESGSYLLTVLLSKNALYAGISEVVQINKSLSTVYTKNFDDDDDLLLTQYTVTYNINGATGGTTPNSQTIGAGSSITLPSGGGLSKTGYAFVGWNTSDDGAGTNYDASTPYTVNGNITLYAKWVIAYTVTFSVNGGSGTVPTAQTAANGYNITLPNGTGLSKSGYLFGGWNTSNDGTGTNYNGGESYTVSDNAILYVKWDVAYTVTFNVNSGTGTVPTAQTVPAGSSITLPSGSGISRTGYTFNGWNTTTAGTETWYAVGDSYTPTSNTTLYARWTSTVTFNINSGSGTTPIAQTVPAGSSITLPDGSGFSRGVYTFNGWNTTTDGNGTNRNAGTSYTPTGNITLYARWTTTVTFDTNGATSGSAPSAQTVPAGSSINLPTGSGFSRSGYTFDGWNTNSSGTGTNYNAGASYTPTANITFYVRWDNADGSEDRPFRLTENIWSDGNITIATNEVWYTFTATAATTYRVWWNDRDGDGTKTLDVRVTAYNSSEAVLFNNVDNGWSSPQTITQVSGTTVKLKVTPFSSNQEGTFVIGYSRGSERSALRIKPPASHTSLSMNSWRDGNITTSAREIWYSFNATAGTTYGVWWNDNRAGDSSKTLEVQVRAYDSNGTELFSLDNGWLTLNTINVTSSGTIYLRVLPRYGVTSSDTGTFAIMYGTGFVRPDIGSTSLTMNSWRNGTIGVWGETWYTFTASAGTTYNVWWNDRSGGDGTKTEDVRVRAYDSNGTELFNQDDAYYSSRTIGPLVSGTTIYLRVFPFSGTAAGGTFAITYSTSSTRP